ncbi:MAG: endolytic transglycosylase MltG [Rickettsiales bacterium]|nr:endolytic transglycosylase MltG [Rickettsiales bacterium]
MKKKKNEKRKMKNAARKNAARPSAKIILATGVLLLFIFLFLFFVFGVRSTISEPAYFEVSGGAPVGAVAAELNNKSFISNSAVFKISVYAFGGRVQRGGYDLPRRASTWRIARMLARGEIASTTVVIPEGLTVKQIVQVLDANVFLRGSACEGKGQKAKGRDINNEEISNNGKGLPSAFCLLPSDGSLFPDTYIVAKGTNRAAVLELMRAKMEKVKRGWEASKRPAPAPLKNWNEIITLASIVQKETPKVSEMPVVASVYLNRLRKKMKLQADPTVVYAMTDRLGDMQGLPLLTGHLKTDSPYNTYVRYGLPPAPIANVGSDAIAAVLNPADTNYLFFVADGQGGHRFAKDYAEHQKNHANWREIKKKKVSNAN